MFSRSVMASVSRSKVQFMYDEFTLLFCVFFFCVCLVCSVTQGGKVTFSERSVMLLHTHLKHDLHM